jgi:serine/threonine protein kinase
LTVAGRETTMRSREAMSHSGKVSTAARRVSREPSAIEDAMANRALGPSVGDSFVLGLQLGHGGMGVVYRARDRLLGRDVALKVLSPTAVQHASAVTRFAVEAQLGAQLEHPNIVPFYQLLATVDHQPAFAMKLVEGETMADYLARCAAPGNEARPPHDLPSRLERFLKVCDAIEYAHARGVVHRDLKPENVMLGTFNEVYVMDWGIAAVTGAPGEGADGGRVEPSSGPVESGVLGTIGYMAPEQARSEAITPATDQYALGMMLAEIATLRTPRAGSTMQQIGKAISNAPPPLVSAKGRAIAPELAAIVGKATATRPEDRYIAVADLAADVRGFASGEPVSVVPDDVWKRMGRRLKRRPALVLAMLSLLGALASAAIGVGLWRELGARKRAAAQAERVSALTAAVARTAHAVDGRFARIELLVEGLAAAAAERLRAPPSDRASAPAPTTADLALPGSSAVLADRYQQRVTFERAVAVRSPRVRDADVDPVLEHEADLEPLLVQVAARAAAGDAVLAQPLVDQRAAARAAAPILWTDLAFERGVVFVYPGNTYFPADYEVRARPWYVAAVDHPGVVWGAPYPDATSGRLLEPCSRAFRDRRGTVAGVAAAHMSLDDILDILVVPEASGFRAASLLDPRGGVVLATGARGMSVGAGVHGNRAFSFDPFPVAAVRDAVAGGVREARVGDGDAIYVIHRLDANDWSLVVAVDAAPYAFR